jgi:hypothetical protein
MVVRQVPACAILLDAQPVSGSNMPAHHFPSPPTFEAHDVIAMNGSPDGHGWSSFDDGLCSRLAEVGKRLMDGGD